MKGALLVAGTTSDAGKSVITAGICRWLHRQGVRVAPFKAQNMSNNSVVTPDGGEIGRAQALQAAACGITPDVRFNPILVKPGSDRTSQLVVLGRPVGSLDARDYLRPRPRLAALVQDTLAELRSEYDVVVCEGAGSPAEINLRATDIVNMGLARAANLPTIVVADIDRGGMFASCYGTVALLDKGDQALVAGFLVNKFRGDPTLLDPGLDTLRQVTGRETYGVVPFSVDLWLDSEDSLPGPGAALGRRLPPVGLDWLRVAVVRLPRISNPTDVDALAAEPGVMVRLAGSPVELVDADLVVLPGTKATVDDLGWLRRTGLADAVIDHAARGRPVLGICGGYQMLGERIHDDVESGQGVVEGLGLLPVRVTFAAAKTLGRPSGTAFGRPAGGYEIHHGTAHVPDGTEHLFRLPDGGGEGARVGAVFGTHWHGTFEHDAYRRAFLTEAARLAGRTGFTVAPDTDFQAVREQMLGLLGDLVEEHVDTAALARLVEHGPPPDLPFLAPGDAWPRPGHRQGGTAGAGVPSAATATGVGSSAYHPSMTREPHTAAPPRTDAELAAEVRRLLPEIRADLESLVRIPSVSFPGFDHVHVRESAEATAELLRAAGMPDVQILSVPDGQPAVVARRPAPPAAPTVLLYAHHDVQPPGNADEWHSPPFEPTERNGRLYGRGTADDKAGIAAHLAAVRAHGDALPIGVTVFVEGEEEAGSPTLGAFLERYRDLLAADVIVIADSSNWAIGRPALTTSLRGLVDCQVEVRTLEHGVHSGMFGGVAPDALTALCRVLATLHDDAGDVAVPGLVSAGPTEVDMTEEEFRRDSSLLAGVSLIGTGSVTERLWSKPAVSVVGIDCPGVRNASNTLIPVARAKVSMRLAPGQNPRAALTALAEHLARNAPWGVRVTVDRGETGSPFAMDATGPAYDAARDAFRVAWDGTPSVDVGLGGSIPFIAAFAETFPDASILVTGVEDPDGRAHGVDESLHLGEFARVCLAEALLLARVARMSR